MKFVRAAVVVAFAGLVVEALGVAWAISLWNQSHPQAYNPLSNFVSELGSPRHLPMARVFNWTLIISSAMSAPLVIALGAHIRTRLSYTAMGLGVLAMLAAIGLGFTPMEILYPHLAFALAFFFGWLAAVLLFTLSFLRSFSFGRSPFLIIAGIAASAACVVFLTILFRAMAGFQASGIHDMASFQRPRIWDIAISEWCVVVSIAVWVLAVSLHLSRAKAGANQ